MRIWCPVCQRSFRSIRRTPPIHTASHVIMRCCMSSKLALQLQRHTEHASALRALYAQILSQMLQQLAASCNPGQA